MPKIAKQSIPSGNLITNFFTQEFEMRSIEELNAKETFTKRSETAVEIAKMRDDRILSNNTGPANDELLFFGKDYFRSALNYVSFLSSNHYVIPTADPNDAEKIITPAIISVDVGLSKASIGNLRPKVKLSILDFIDTEETLYNILFTSRFGNRYSDRVTSHHELMYPKGQPGALSWNNVETSLPNIEDAKKYYAFEPKPVQGVNETAEDFAARQLSAFTFDAFATVMAEAGKPMGEPIPRRWVEWLDGNDDAGNANFKISEWYDTLKEHFVIPDEYETIWVAEYITKCANTFMNSSGTALKNASTETSEQILTKTINGVLNKMLSVRKSEVQSYAAELIMLMSFFSQFIQPDLDENVTNNLKHPTFNDRINRWSRVPMCRNIVHAIKQYWIPQKGSHSLGTLCNRLPRVLFFHPSLLINCCERNVTWRKNGVAGKESKCKGVVFHPTSFLDKQNGTSRNSVFYRVGVSWLNMWAKRVATQPELQIIETDRSILDRFTDVDKSVTPADFFNLDIKGSLSFTPAASTSAFSNSLEKREIVYTNGVHMAGKFPWTDYPYLDFSKGRFRDEIFIKFDQTRVSLASETAIGINGDGFLDPKVTESYFGQRDIPFFYVLPQSHHLTHPDQPNKFSQDVMSVEIDYNLWGTPHDKADFNIRDWKTANADRSLARPVFEKNGKTRVISNGETVYFVRLREITTSHYQKGFVDKYTPWKVNHSVTYVMDTSGRSYDWFIHNLVAITSLRLVDESPNLQKVINSYAKKNGIKDPRQVLGRMKGSESKVHEKGRDELIQAFEDEMNDKASFAQRHQYVGLRFPTTFIESGGYDVEKQPYDDPQDRLPFLQVFGFTDVIDTISEYISPTPLPATEMK